MMRTLLFILFFPIYSFSQTTFTKVINPNNDLAQQSPIPSYNGVSWIDYDGDGWEDCFINSNNLYRNKQDGTFEKINFSPINPGGGNGASWGDYDGDGDPDVIIAAAPTHLYRNDIDSFTNVSFLASPIDTFNFWSAAWGDYDEDGWLDLALIHPAGFIPFNNPISRPSIILKNNQDGTFSYVNTPLDNSLAAHTIGTWTDFDLDNDLDLFVGSGEVNRLSRDHIYVNQLTETGTATLERLNTGVLGISVRDGQNWNFIDYDLDGDLDAFVTNYNAGKNNDLYRNDDGTYVRETADSAGTIAEQGGAGLNNVWADFDNDGYQDCFVVFDGNQKDHYYHNNGDGTFTEQEHPFTIAATTRGAAAGDYDNDGFMDLMVSATTANAVGLYHNEGNDNNWFHLNLEGNASNTSAIGAKVRVKASLNGEAKWQMREVNVQNTFNGHNSLRLHFGLADAMIIDTMEIIWADGSRQIAVEIQPNQICVWKQGEESECGRTLSATNSYSSSSFLYIYPNPVSGTELNIQYSFEKIGKTHWIIYDATGKKTNHLKGSFPTHQEEKSTIEIDQLSVGTYILELQCGKEKAQKKFVVTR